MKLAVLLALFSLASSAVVRAFHPAHVPKNHDEFAYLLAGQTFASFRLANATPALPAFFETPHVLLEPSYMAKYPPGHGGMLAIGYWLGNPLYGVWLECALFTGATTWMLLGFFSARWAVLGGVLVIVQLGLTHYWAQSYWGGALAAAGGALVFGATRRLWRQPSPSAAIAMGSGAVVLMMTRPFEGILACFVPGAVLLAKLWKEKFGAPILQRVLLPFIIVGLTGATFLCIYQWRTTGSPWRPPYLEYEKQYSGAPIFIWDKPGAEPVFRNNTFQDYHRDYVLIGSQFHVPLRTILVHRWREMATGVLGASLAFALLPGFLLRPSPWCLLATASLILVSAALLLCYWFGFHYQAPAVALHIFLAVAGLRTMFLSLRPAWRKFRILSLAIGSLLIVDFARAESREHRFAQLESSTMRQKTMDILRAAGGKHIVFVHLEKPYDPNVCWVCNDALLAEAPVIWAWDRGPAENRQLLTAFPGRRAVLMTLRGQQIDFAAYPSASTAAAP